jgi:pyruvate formate lyase activating enzyme
MPKQEARVFNIVHGSFVDGWGVRTTVFLKGCPLRCTWCCNPEGQSFDPELRFIASHCNGCGRCVPVCEPAAISIADELAVIDRERCNACMNCVDSCYYGALAVFGKPYSPEELFAIVKRDEQFYLHTGGGVSIGGGEATCYPDFCLELIGLCHEAGIHVAVDTCGYLSSERGWEVLTSADLLLFDIKGMDDEKHRRNTGVSNQPIHDTLRRLDRAGKEMIIRMPVIPGYNDDDEELTEAADMIASLGSVRRVDILPYHPYGRSKYDEIGKPYADTGSSEGLSVSDDRQAEILEMFRSRGVTAQIGG